MKGFTAKRLNCATITIALKPLKRCWSGFTIWTSTKRQTELNIALAVFEQRWLELTEDNNMTAIFLDGNLLMTLKMSPANARQAIEANFQDAGELPLVFAAIPTL